MRTGEGRNLTTDLREALGRAIVGGSFVNGFPTETELSAMYGLSRSVIREAVKMLAGKGLLSGRARTGTVIEPRDRWNLLDPDVLRWLLDRQFSLGLLRQFSELRLAIEPTAAALAAMIPDNPGLAAIKRSLDRMGSPRGEHDMLKADIEFHIAILHAAQNPFFRQFEELVRTALHTSIQFTSRVSDRTTNIARHRDVHEAIRAGEPEAARAAMCRLIDGALELIGSADGDDDPVGLIPSGPSRIATSRRRLQAARKRRGERLRRARLSLP